MRAPQTLLKKFVTGSIKVNTFVLVGLLLAFGTLYPSQRALALRAPQAAQACNGENNPCTVPYFVVQGGDLANGSSFFGISGNASTGAGYDTCLKQQTAWYGGYNNDGNNANPNTSYKGYFGAAVQGGAFTPDVNQEVASDLNSNQPLSTLTTNANPYTYGGLNSGSALPSPQTPTSPYYLGFANNYSFGGNINSWPPDLQELYGGQFYTSVAGASSGLASAIPCMPDYYGAVPSSSPNISTGGAGCLSGSTVDLSKCSSGTYIYSGTLTVNDSARVQPNVHITLAVNGNVIIANNITYVGYNLNSIPSIQISVGTNNMYAMNANHIATGSGTTNGACSSDTSNNTFTINDTFSSADTNNNCLGFKDYEWDTTQWPFSGNGNIYIANNVTEIHGIFTAESAGSFGAIHTCGSSYNNEYSLNASAANCGQQLRVYGAMAANYFFLARSTGGNVTKPTSCVDGSSPITNSCNASELFQYSPELWIPPTYSTTVTCGSPCVSSNYQTVTSLPPVL